MEIVSSRTASLTSITDALTVNVDSTSQPTENVFHSRQDASSTQEVSVLDALKTSDSKEDNAESKDVLIKELIQSLDHSAKLVNLDSTESAWFVKFNTALNSWMIAVWSAKTATT